MDCFGEIQKLPSICTDSFQLLESRFVQTRPDSTIIATESPNLITKYDISNGKPIQSWSFPELNKLLTPISVYYPSPTEETFVGIHSGNVLHEWIINNNNELEIKHKMNYKAIVRHIISFNPHNIEPLVIFANGFAEFLTKAKLVNLNDFIKPVLEVNEMIIGIKHHVVILENVKVILLYYIVKNKDIDDKLTVYKLILKVNQTNNTIRKLVNAEKVDTWAYHHGIDCLIGAAKSNDGKKILIYSLEPSNETANSDKRNIVFEFDTNPSDISEICSIGVCQNGYICLLIKKRTNEHNYRLQVFETKYNTMISEFNLTEPILKENSLKVINNSVLVTCKNNVRVFPILKRKLFLSQLVTKDLDESVKSQLKSENISRLKKNLGIECSLLDDNLNQSQLIIVNKKFEKLISKNNGDFPEELIISLFDDCTRTFISVSNSSTENKEQILHELENFFGLIIKIPFNEIFLVSCLKSSNISFEQHQLAIDFLLNRLPCKDCSVILWISAILDTNFRQFIIKPNDETQAIVTKINQKLEKSILFYEELSPIKSLLDTLLKGNQQILKALTNEDEKVGQYSIDLLSFT
ncbi:hypothetical protein RDWZM_000804 [Blomia tropicalis]|uniref:Nucleolar protein 11 N-terminal domain-containing protein n=1 Tax=Blomia tropicalis TaxID=40697 RepID=A0A9Q0MB95_BLOTA|nr:hypothetical protein RDWZM_000804 [Blomia tropicalis]